MNERSTTDLDVLIVGGGLVGSSLAIALDGSGLRVALAEANVSSVAPHASLDERNLALAQASVVALGVLGVWPALAARAQAIRRVHVSRSGEFGAMRLDAAAFGVESLGAVVPARELGEALLRRLASCNGLVRYAPATVSQLDWQVDAVQVRLREGDQERALRTRLLVAADGTNSFVRNAAGIGTQAIDYAQTLFVGSVQTERSLDGCAYERFSDAGPVALLPLSRGRAGVVLSVADSEAARVAALDDAGFLDLVQQRFGWRTGRFSRPGRRSQHPIRRIVADTVTAPRTLLIGNAAQTIHPIGAQGFNLGLRDALTLAESLIAAARSDRDPGSAGLLAHYAQSRREDRDGTLAFSDGLVRLACNPSTWLSPLRSLGLILLDGVTPLKRRIAQRGMGFRGEPTAYALGRAP